VQLAIDDFGTGYSSLSYLSRLPVDYLKIDSSFVGGLGSDTDKNEELVSAMTSLGHTLGLQTIAEGVETAEQLGQLRELGCDMAQGYYFSKPLPSKAAAALLGSDSRW
jgi:EAL domain-containing protein (putative c-di-GMP-specific phosphodiesterase class I)